MILNLIKRAIKNVLHEAVEEWAVEIGLDDSVVREVRSHREALALQAQAKADDEAARALDVEDESDRPLALPMPAAAQTTGAESETGREEETELMAWVHEQRQRQVSWADIASAATARGHGLSAEALRGRYGRWRDRQGDGTAPGSSSS